MPTGRPPQAVTGTSGGSGGGGAASGSFSARQTAAAATARDPYALSALAVIGLLGCYHHRSGLLPHEWVHMCAHQAALLAALTWVLLAPARYRRRRAAIMSVVRLIIGARDLGVGMDRLLLRTAPEPGRTLAAVVHFAFSLSEVSGVIMLGQAVWMLELPPLLEVAVHLLSPAAVATTSSRICAGVYMECPLSRKLLNVAHTRLGLLAAPLAPLLALMGVGSRHTNHACITMLATLQFCVAFLLPIFLALQRDCRIYLAWREKQQQARHEAGAPGSLPAAAPAGSGGGSWGGSYEEAASASAPSAAQPHPSQQQSQQQQQQQQQVASGARRPQGLGSSGTSSTSHPDDWHYEVAARWLSAVPPTRQLLSWLAFSLLYTYCWTATMLPHLRYHQSVIYLFNYLGDYH